MLVKWSRTATRAGLVAMLGLTMTGQAFAQASGRAETPVRGGTFIGAINPEPTVLNVTYHNQYANAAVSANVFDGLVTYDSAQKAQPSLAESWSVSPDGLSITFKLRKDVKWHDGVPFTSADVRYSALEIWKKVHPRGRVTFAPLKDVETPDAYTAIFKLEHPAAVILSSLNTAEAQILPKHLYENTDVRKNPYNAKPVGTGPFRFKDWKKGQYVELERNPDYWEKGKPYLDRVIFRTIPDAAARGAALETGEIQYVPFAGVPFSDVARLRKDPGLKFQTSGYAYNAQVYFIEFNLRRPFLKDLKVRQALAHAIDKQGLIDTVWYGLSKVVDQPIPEAVSTFHTTKNIPRYDFDPAKAEKLLDEAGYPRKADGTRFSVTINLSPSSDRYQFAGEYFRQSLKRIGVELKPIAADVPTYLRKVYTEYDFDMLIQGYSVLLDPQMGLTRIFWSKAATPGVPYVNASGYASADADRVIEAYQKEADQKKRIGLFNDFQRIVMTDLPLLPLMDAPFFSIYSSKVHGLDPGADAARASLKDVWLSR